jgi:hypothetical protein
MYKVSSSCFLLHHIVPLQKHIALCWPSSPTASLPEKTMEIGSQITSVVFRSIELISASIIAGLVGAYLHYVSDAGAEANGRMVYTMVIAGISIFFSIVFMPPLKYSFYGFPLDFALFICWMVAFGLLDNVRLTSSYHAFLSKTNFPGSKNTNMR